MTEPTVHYIKRLPGKIRGGMVLVHNHAKPQRILSANGFRAWIAPLDDTKHMQCDCGWPAKFGRPRAFIIA
jgi:hypothetical protein